MDICSSKELSDKSCPGQIWFTEDVLPAKTTNKHTMVLPSGQLGFGQPRLDPTNGSCLAPTNATANGFRAMLIEVALVRLIPHPSLPA